MIVQVPSARINQTPTAKPDRAGRYGGGQWRTVVPHYSLVLAGKGEGGREKKKRDKLMYRTPRVLHEMGLDKKALLLTAYPVRYDDGYHTAGWPRQLVELAGVTSKRKLQCAAGDRSHHLKRLAR